MKIAGYFQQSIGSIFETLPFKNDLLGATVKKNSLQYLFSTQIEEEKGGYPSP
jgi:hypothetical protein